MAIFKYKNELGNFISIPAIKGDTGLSAYEQAVTGGYTGTLADFYVDLAALETAVTDAQTAETNAELAETNAETAETNASASASEAAASALQLGAAPLTTAGDLMTFTTVPARLGIGTAGKVLKVNSGATGLEWGTDIDTTYPAASTSEAGLAPQATAPASGLRNVLAIENGETAYTNKALFDATSPSTQAFGDTAVVGTAVVAARRDHKHVMPAESTPASIGAATTALASTSATGLSPQVTAPAAGLLNILGVENGETARTDKALFDATAPSTQAIGDSAAIGSAMAAARRDHKHAMPPTADLMTAIQTVDGTTSGLDADLLDGNHAAAFAVAAHAHGNLTTDGKVGTVTDLPLMTGTGGLVVAKTMAEAIAIWKFTNPNLLHNWDFRFNPVNQRAASGTISGSTYFYDRWYKYTPGTLTLSAGSIAINGQYTDIEQRIEGNALAGLVCTTSININGTITSWTGTFPTSTGDAGGTVASGLAVNFTYATGYMAVRFTYIGTTSITNIRSVKLELGTVSTLAYDPPMEYGVELAKCQRYFYAFNVNGSVYVLVGYGSASSTTEITCVLPLPVTMRIIPTLVTLGSHRLVKSDWAAAYAATAVAIGTTLTSFNSISLNVSVASGLTAGAMYAFGASNDATARLQFSADL